MELNRHETREKALQSLFPLTFDQALSKEKVIEYVLTLDHQDWVSEDQQSFVPAYLDLLVNGVCEHQAELDELIQKNLHGWTLNRIAKIDLVILRLALFEMLYVEDVPALVAINEAVELAKKYSDDVSRKFVNGVLSNVLKEQAK